MVRFVRDFLEASFYIKDDYTFLAMTKKHRTCFLSPKDFRGIGAWIEENCANKVVIVPIFNRMATKRLDYVVYCFENINDATLFKLSNEYENLKIIEFKFFEEIERFN